MQDMMLRDLVELPAINEAAILSTCNRTEIYCDTDDASSLITWLASKHHLAPETLSPHVYLHPGDQGIRHALRVASGLDSMMLGEPQILGQLKQAYQQACRLGTVKRNLQHIFQYIFSASKRIRRHSGIGKNPVSVAFVAVQLIGELFKDFKSLNVLIIGSGETSALVTKYLHQQGVERFMVASRTRDNAHHLASAYAGEALSITDIPSYLPKADIVISATACPLPFINKNMVEQAMQQRQQAPMFFLDLAVPRDIEPEVSHLANVHLYNIDDLQILIDKGLDQRRAAAIKAEQLIECEIDDFMRQYRSLSAKGIICDYRNHMQHLAQQELQRALQKLSSGKCQYSVLTEFSERLVNKLTHNPTVGLRQAAVDDRPELLELIHYLFNRPAEITSP